MSWTALVLAGARPGLDPFAEAFGTDLKALIPIGGEPMVRRPVSALLASRSIGTILVAAQQPERIAAALPVDRRISFRRSQGTIAETILGLVESKEALWPLLVTTADHALLDCAMVDEFCSKAEGANVAIGVVERRSLLARLPDTRRTWLRFRDGAFTGANLFALSSADVAPAIELWRSVEQDRKKALRVIALLGPFVLAASLLRLVSLDEVLARLGARIGLAIKAVRMTNPLAGVDVDKPSDHELVERIFEGRA
jgi:GTP:adenosylcobinamide-phosphate guanylyltransferase